MRSTRSLAVIASLGAAAALALAGCSQGSDSSASGDAASGDAASSGASGSVITLNVGASPTPHAKILQYIQDNLAADAGLDLNIVEYSDYVQPNVALNDGSLDANYFQTVPYLEQQEEESGYDFTAGEGVHLEPLAIYSDKITDLADFPEGGTIGIISDTANQSRALALLADNGFVELPADGTDANVNTVTKLKDFDFQEVEGAQLVRSLQDVDLAVINGNYAQEGGLSQADDALAVESAENNPAVNVLVWKTDVSGDKKAGVEKLEELLHSDEVKQFIEDTWTDGSVIPAF
ncbi:MAG: MetQ/NlpA family ABC transporter substrate-binding protein [Actinomyces sp.]|jgi:D-methionine transport system substrate-binding protein|nr:MetQ/NlpA family ABC transporter substrate-binding protein [Actinomyces sp.]MCI1642597.1 MetQ/NlpA family ABC transporter substrate-binding protein [Actinomyces sp.]MCI1663149.1 MetQ/NlpA family ABC transporter substrate-binding protein [Actinomyces sp.]MCI1691714.1 MetQ/NlpA family ABC transporter substrate-binding protein [Actinomyces sp.]MCI1788567.1 MetQ/NlpA family ABC transporter substrate-binding protein [Actinomyces sp.]